MGEYKFERKFDFAEYLKKYLADRGLMIDECDYRFLNQNGYLNENICLLGFGGSYAYGTNKEGSDIDIRGFATHTVGDILNMYDFQQVVEENTDTTIYSIRKMFQLLTECNPNTMEILGLKDYIYKNEIGDMVLDNVDIFLSNACVKSFMGYANQQLYRLQQKTLVALTPAQLNQHIAKTVNGMKDHLVGAYGEVAKDIEVKVDNSGELILTIPELTCKMEKVEKVINEMHNVISSYKKESKRNKQAIEHAKVAKHSMHLLRLYMMCEDLLLTGKIITTRTKEHDLLMDIRNGKFLGEDQRPNAEFFKMVDEYDERVKKAAKKSVLPSKPKYDAIQDLYMTINQIVMSKYDLTAKDWLIAK